MPFTVLSRCSFDGIWWFCRSMRTTRASVLRSAFAAARPPKPPPAITTRGVESGMMALHNDPPRRQLDDQSENREQERQGSWHPHDNTGERLVVDGRIPRVNQP